ncbi:MAG: cytochrome c [Chloroflexia bacterium]
MPAARAQRLGEGRRRRREYFYPPASNLTAPGTRDKSDAELRWIIKEGLAFTGMPGYGARMDDQRIWSIVAYLRTLPPQPWSRHAPSAPPRCSAPPVPRPAPR